MIKEEADYKKIRDMLLKIIIEMGEVIDDPTPKVLTAALIDVTCGCIAATVRLDVPKEVFASLAHEAVEIVEKNIFEKRELLLQYEDEKSRKESTQ